jgi:exopolyphosphatase / guanosine-5'-triphosphate,3'-diphosphate pyrophosphatase
VSKRYAVISVGTNSTRLLLADLASQDRRADLARWVGTRIGEGLGSQGSLGEEPMRRTIDAISQLHRTVRGRYVRLFAIATSALRRADNAKQFEERVQAALGVPLRILAGDEEAAASYRGALTSLGALRGERVGVADVGGGSTEYAIGTGVAPERHVSCEIGAVRLTEGVPALSGRDGNVDGKALERAQAMAKKALAQLEGFDAVERLAFVGGSATTSAAIARKSRAISTARLTRADLRDVLSQLCAMPLEERKTVKGMNPQRADILPAGIIVLDAVLEIAGRDEAMATRADLLLGFLLQQWDAANVKAGQRPSLPAGSNPRKRGFEA